MALLLPPLAGRELRAPGASTSRARASAARRTSAYVQRGSIRTLMWIPREPDVFGQPTSPTASSASRQTSATSRICGHSMPGTGSRSTRSSSGWSRSSARTGCGFRSMQPRLTTQASPAGSSRTISSAVRPDGKGQLGGPDPVGRVVGRPLLEERLLRDPVDEPLEGHRPAAGAAERARRRQPGSTRRGPSSCSRARGSRPCPGSRPTPRGRRSRGSPCGWAWNDASRRSQGGARCP